MRARWLALALLCACDASGPPGPSALLITLDTTRADALSCYGNARARTPALDALAAEGVLYEAAHTVAPLTLPAHASILTGLYPIRHGLRDNGLAALPRSAETLAERARSAGLRTAAFVSSVVLDDAFGLDQGFESYDTPRRRAAGDPERRTAAERPARATIDAALAWLEQLGKDERFFLWIHLYDPHFPYDPPPPFARELQDLPYLGEVAAMDREIGRLLERLRASGALERTFVLAVGDHGEALGEHGELTHGAYCYEGTLRVPLIARFPGGARAGERSGELLSAVDVCPTLAEALGIPAPSGPAGAAIDGASFFRARPGGERGIYCESYYGYLTYGWSPLAGWIDARGKYLHSSAPELYDLARDPLESSDLAGERAGELERYRRALAEIAGRPALEPSAEPLDEQALEGIQDLGYAALGDPASALPHPLDPSDRPSPRSQSSFLGRHARAQELGEAGALEEAAAIYEELVRENPRNLFAREELASCRLRQGRAGDAVALLEQVVEEGPPRGKPCYELGLALRATGRLDEAIGAFARAVELTGGRRRYLETLLELLEKTGRSAERAELEERYRRRPEKPRGTAREPGNG